MHPHNIQMPRQTCIRAHAFSNTVSDFRDLALNAYSPASKSRALLNTNKLLISLSSLHLCVKLKSFTTLKPSRVENLFHGFPHKPEPWSSCMCHTHCVHSNDRNWADDTRPLLLVMQDRKKQGCPASLGISVVFWTAWRWKLCSDPLTNTSRRHAEHLVGRPAVSFWLIGGTHSNNTKTTDRMCIRRKMFFSAF